MPVYERRFFIDKMITEAKEKQESMENAKNKRNI
tara:strand:- start:717 stop:818 length:102 start_codon:yes stop_codon:yes gene_type:complete